MKPDDIIASMTDDECEAAYQDAFRDGGDLARDIIKMITPAIAEKPILVAMIGLAYAMNMMLESSLDNYTVKGEPVPDEALLMMAKLLLATGEATTSQVLLSRVSSIKDTDQVMDKMLGRTEPMKKGRVLQ